jgi:AraC family transcriptional regulator
MATFSIKNMVCARCIKTVTAIFRQHDIEPSLVRLGELESRIEPSLQQMESIRKELIVEGFELLDDQRSRLINQIRNEIIQLVHYGELDDMKLNLSAYLSQRLNKDYHYLSNIFSSVEGTTIEQFFIQQKIEKVKEWLVYNEYTLNEMAFKLGYSSVAHLSSQFKKITGLTPSGFKKLKAPHRKPLDKI